MSTIEITDQNFEAEVLKHPNLVLVDFWATWCGPCKMLAPIIEELAQEKAGTLKVGKLDVDKYQETASQFGIKGLPTLLLFKAGQLVGSTTGIKPKNTLVEWIDSYLN